MPSHAYFYKDRRGTWHAFRASHKHQYLPSKGCYGTTVYIWSRPADEYTPRTACRTMSMDRWKQLRRAGRIRAASELEALGTVRHSERIPA